MSSHCSLICCLFFLQYYALDITYFKSSLDCHLLDLLWNKYWVNTLSSSPLLGNGDYVAGQISDLGNSSFLVSVWRKKCCCMDSIVSCLHMKLYLWLSSWLFILVTLFHLAAEKLEQAENQLAHSRIGPLGPPRKKVSMISFVILYARAVFQDNLSFFQ